MNNLSTEYLLNAYRKMLTIRIAEETIAEDFKRNKIFSFLHLYTGQEAVAVGVADALQPTDLMLGNHRSHGHYIAKGGKLAAMFREIYGKEGGCCNGKGGSMHMLDRSVGFMGTTPILGSVVPIAAGFAFAQKFTETGNVVVAFYGDGASEEGAIYETMNLAATLRLPLVLVLEDNLYAVNSPASARRANSYRPELVVRGLGMEYRYVDGTDFVAVHNQAGIAIQRARKYDIPSVLHAVTYREMAHSGPIKDESVREIDTAEVRKNADPIERLFHQLTARGITLASLRGLRDIVDYDVATAFTEMQSSPDPNPAHAEYDVYAN